MTSQGERKWRVARWLKVATSLKLASPATIRRMTNVIRVVTTVKTIFTAEVMAGEDSEGITDALGMEPYQFEPVGSIGSSEDESSSEDEEEAEWRLNNTNWCPIEVRVSFACFLSALNAMLAT